MREIKFRAWDKKNKQMIYDIGYIEFSPKGINVGYNVNWDYDGEGKLEGSQSSSIDDISLMQFIGLKDKNGKKIYEGDIMKTDGKIGIVEYREFGFNCLTPSTGKDVEFRLDLFSVGIGEIIGNIHSNPELIEQKVEK